MATKRVHFLILVGCMALTGLISLYLGKDVNWDLRNYHYYIGYAFLNLSPHQDFFAAGVESYLNPLTDALNYLMIKKLPPQLTGFLLGAVQGLNLYLLWGMALMLTASVPAAGYRVMALIMIPLLGLLCANVIGEIGTTFNDLTLANLVLLSLYLVGFSLRDGLAIHKKLTYLFFAGCVLGIGIGLKLTMALYFIGAIAALITLQSLDGVRKYKILFLFSLGSLLGFLLTNGYWMAVLWKFFHNPVFPYYNQFFKSPYYYAKNIIDSRYLPHNFWQTLFYPFYFSWQSCLTNDAYFRDFRLPVIYSLLIIYISKVLMTKKPYSAHYHAFQKQYIQFLIVFFVIAYLIWQYQFSIQRYIMVLDLLAPLIIYLLITNIINDQPISHSLVFVILVLLAVTLIPQRWARLPWAKPYFMVKIPPTIDLQKKSVVINLDFGISFLRPFFPADWHFLSAGLPWFPTTTCFPRIDNFNVDFPYLNPIIGPWLQNPAYRYYVLFLDTPTSTVEQTLKRYQLSLAKPCSVIQTNIQNYFICPLSPR